MPLQSNWTLEVVLNGLEGVTRIDDRGDLLAFRVAGEHRSRTVYVYLYGDDPAAIYYDLEDGEVDIAEWDNAVHRGEVRTTQELNDIVSRWLNGSSPEPLSH